jgi:hypothetical protein
MAFLRYQPRYHAVLVDLSIGPVEHLGAGGGVAEVGDGETVRTSRIPGA